MKKFKKFLTTLFFESVFFMLKVSLVWAAPAAVTEFEVSDISGLKLEILKRPDSAKKIGEKRWSSSRRKKLPAPEFPEDLTIIENAGKSRRSWFPWDPTGANKFPTSAECSQEALRDVIWKRQKTSDQGKDINAWVQRCSSEISSLLSRRSIVPLIKFVTMSYDFSDNPHVHAVKATLPDGRVLSGFVAMKPDDLPRPFVIAKCGVFCSGQASTSHRAFMMHFFDEAPFHVLALANNTGSDFQRDNKALSVGGFDEGRQLYQIAQLLRSPRSPIAKRISSVHVVGASLGGNAALYAGLYSSLNEPNIQSVTALCPVVVVEKTVKRLYTAKPISILANFDLLHRLRDLFYVIPALAKVFPEGLRRLRSSRLFAKLSEAILVYYRDWTEKEPWDLDPFKGVRITSLPQFWQLNDFRNFIQHIRVPTLAVAAENDDLVRSENNSKLLKAALAKTPNRDLDTVFFKQGNHCAFGLANGWGNYSMLLREFILSHSPETQEHWKERRVRLPAKSVVIGENESVVQTLWRAYEGDPNLYLKLSIYSGRERGREITIKIPIRSLPLKY